jgi:hypothetical protein
VPIDPKVAKLYTNQLEHDPADLAAARRLAAQSEHLALGLFYRNAEAPGYEGFTERGLEMSDEQRLAAVEAELDRFAI